MESEVQNYCALVNDKYDLEKVTVDLNALDVKGGGIDGLYLTVTGTSVESGQVGRGRVRGFCTDHSENGVELKSVSKLINEVIIDEFDHLMISVEI